MLDFQIHVLYFELFVKYIIRPSWTCCMKCFTKSFLYYQQGSKSLKENKGKESIKEKETTEVIAEKHGGQLNSRSNSFFFELTPIGKDGKMKIAELLHLKLYHFTL